MPYGASSYVMGISHAEHKLSHGISFVISTLAQTFQVRAHSPSACVSSTGAIFSNFPSSSAWHTACQHFKWIEPLICRGQYCTLAHICTCAQPSWNANIAFVAHAESLAIYAHPVIYPLTLSPPLGLFGLLFYENHLFSVISIKVSDSMAISFKVSQDLMDSFY